MLGQGDSKVEDANLHVIHLDQDDPRKCTARKLHSMGLVQLHESVTAAPRRGYLLDPLSETILSREDSELISIGGSIVVLDCSWKKVAQSLEGVLENSRLESRVLPLLLPANPTSWGKVGRLTSAEAIGATLAILGYWDQAERILRHFKFGKEFIELNLEPLKSYSNASTREQVAYLQKEFF